jgi:hypothetical protein
MKFEASHDRSVEDTVAYIDKDGDLVIKDSSDTVVCLSTEVGIINYIDSDWNPEEEGVKQRFHKGDTVMITL